MLRYAAIAAMLTVLLPTVPSMAVTAKQKRETCKFGADDQKLTGAARKTFMARCMSDKDDPRGAGTQGAAPPMAASPPPPPARQ
jgi:psiF repeat